MSIDDFRLRTKILVPIGMMAVTMLAMVAFGANRLFSVSDAASKIIEQRDVATVKIARAGRLLVEIPYAVDGVILNDDDTPAGAAAKQSFESSAASAQSLLQAAADLLPDQADAIGKFRERLKAIVELAKPAYELGLQLPGVDHGRDLKPEQIEGLAKAAKLATSSDASARKLIADMAAYNDGLVTANAQAAQGLQTLSQNAIEALSAFGALSAVLAIAFSFWMTAAKIVRPLKRLSEQMRTLAGGDTSLEIEGAHRRDEIGEMSKAVEVFKSNAIDRRNVEARAVADRSAADADRERATSLRQAGAEAQSAAMGALRDGLKRLADGNLTVKLEQGFSAEYAEVRDDFNAAAGKLRGALSAVVVSTGTIHSSTREISAASDNLSHRTEQQAANLEETAAALEEITTTLKQSAQGAQHAAEVVATADADAKNGAVIVRKAVEAMDAIAESSSKIGQIIGVIDEIAFQTNLLALNAGVEAARAGDSGKGFAVVASEVRALAQRSAEAAKEIKSLVSMSGAQVESGVKLVADTGKALENIISQVSEINKVVADIAAGAQQQATGLQQINTAIGVMDQSTQQNATMVEESTSASHSLSQATGELQRLIEQFRVGDPGETKLRRELKAVAPHAFAKPAAPAPRAQPKTSPREIARAPKALAAGGAAASDWTEF